MNESSRKDPVEQYKRGLEFEVRVLECIIALTRDAYKMTHYIPSHDIGYIAMIAEKKLETLKLYHPKKGRASQKINKKIFDAFLKKQSQLLDTE